MAGARPTPREPRRRSGDLAVALVCAILVGILGLLSWLGMLVTQPHEENAEELPTHPVTHDSMAATYTYDGELIRWYVLRDPDFGIQYLVNDRGGCCVRLDAYGNVMGVSHEAEG